MLNPGTHLCPCCGQTSTDFYYSSGITGQALLQLIWNQKMNTYVLEDEDRNPFLLRNQFSITPESLPQLSIEAAPAGSRNYVTYHWCCPHCNNRFLTPLIHQVPGYVIAVMGNRKAGKTSWLGALSTTALYPLSWLNYPYKLHLEIHTSSRAPIQATPNENTTNMFDINDSNNDTGVNNTNYLHIIHNETGHTVALVYLLDYSGESFNDLNTNTAASRLLKGSAGINYTGVDALVLVEPADTDAKYINQLRQITGIEKIPIAHMRTFGDKLLEQECQKGQDPQYSPLFTEKTFPVTVYTDHTTEHPRIVARHFTPDAIAQRMHLQNHIAHRSELGMFLDNKYRDHSRHFLVQSCVSIPVGNGEQANDYSKQFNTADPLLWLLHELKLFPLILNGG